MASLISSNDIRKLIRLTPELKVQIKGQPAGRLVAMNQDHLMIEWDSPSSFDTHAAALLGIVLANGRRIELSIQTKDSSIVPADAQSADTLLDLLHQIRKEQHISICATEDIEGTKRDHGFERVTLPRVALPELAWDEIDTSREFLGQVFGAPLLITGMTGGIEKAAMINERLAHAATTYRIPMGVGSQRIALENTAHSSIFQLKDKFPKLFLIGNVGIAQILHKDWQRYCEQAVAMIQADALAIHVNVLQELIQVEGDRDFRGVISRIGEIARSMPVPVLVKEVGAGLDPKTIQALYDVGVRYFDVSGRGGTSWALIEGKRSANIDIQRLGHTFRDWGITTADALAGATALNLKDCTFVATGGMRDGVTVLKSLYAGATMAGLGLPLFRAALASELGPTRELEHILRELKIAMMCGGTAKLPSRSHHNG